MTRPRSRNRNGSSTTTVLLIAHLFIIQALRGEDRFGPEIVAMVKQFASDVSGGRIADCALLLPKDYPV